MSPENAPLVNRYLHDSRAENSAAVEQPEVAVSVAADQRTQHGEPAGVKREAGSPVADGGNRSRHLELIAAGTEPPVGRHRPSSGRRAVSTPREEPGRLHCRRYRGI